MRGTQIDMHKRERERKGISFFVRARKGLFAFWTMFRSLCFTVIPDSSAHKPPLFISPPPPPAVLPADNGSSSVNFIGKRASTLCADICDNGCTQLRYIQRCAERGKWNCERMNTKKSVTSSSLPITRSKERGGLCKKGFYNFLQLPEREKRVHFRERVTFLKRKELQPVEKGFLVAVSTFIDWTQLWVIPSYSASVMDTFINWLCIQGRNERERERKRERNGFCMQNLNTNNSSSKRCTWYDSSHPYMSTIQMLSQLVGLLLKRKICVWYEYDCAHCPCFIVHK